MTQPAGSRVTCPWRLLTDRGREAAAAVEHEAARLSDWTATTARITPRFRTPLERELSS